MAMMWRTRQLNIPVQQAVCLLRRRLQQAVPGTGRAGSACAGCIPVQHCSQGFDAESMCHFFLWR